MNILIISDNKDLCSFVAKILIGMNQSVVLRFTDHNRKKDYIAGISWDLIDLNDTLTIERII